MQVVAGSNSSPLGRALSASLEAGFIDVAFEKHPGGFPDGEQYVRLLGDVAGEDVVLVQSTHPERMIVELFLLQDAIHEGGARSISLVVPYMGYARQDRRFEKGEPISSRAMAARMSVGVDSVLTVSVHNPEVLRFFNVPAKDVSGMPAVARYLEDKGVDFIVAPDGNASRFAEEVGRALDRPWEAMDKSRIDSTTVTIAHRDLDVRGKAVAIVDDVISTGATVAESARLVRDQGADRVFVGCVHGLFSKGSLDRLSGLDGICATDTLPHPVSPISVAPEIAKALEV